MRNGIEKGDKVIILKKSIGFSLEKCGIPKYSGGTVVYLGIAHIGIKPEIHSSSLFFGSYSFDYNDIKLIDDVKQLEDLMTKFTINENKGLSFTQLTTEAKGMTMNEINSFIVNFMLKYPTFNKDTNINNQLLLTYVINNNKTCLLDFLIKNNYIFVKEKFYSIGDKFKYKDTYYDWTCMLCEIGDGNVVPIIINSNKFPKDTGRIYSIRNITKVSSIRKITESELEKILGKTNDWEKIDES